MVFDVQSVRQKHIGMDLAGCRLEPICSMTSVAYPTSGLTEAFSVHGWTGLALLICM